MTTNRLIINEGDTHKEVSIKPGDLVAFERKYGMSYDDLSVEVVNEDGTKEIKPSSVARIEHTFFMAWNALRRSGQDTRTFEEFLDNVDDIEDPDEPDPLDPPADS